MSLSLRGVLLNHIYTQEGLRDISSRRLTPSHKACEIQEVGNLGQFANQTEELGKEVLESLFEGASSFVGVGPVVAADVVLEFVVDVGQEHFENHQRHHLYSIIEIVP